MLNSKHTTADANSDRTALKANDAGVLDAPIPIEADRIALTNMFKAIAEYGRRVRLRQQAEADLLAPDTLKIYEEDAS